MELMKQTEHQQQSTLLPYYINNYTECVHNKLKVTVRSGKTERRSSLQSAEFSLLGGLP